MRILALDLATKTGWAIATAPVTSGTWDLAPQRLRKFESPGARYRRLHDRIRELHEAQPLEMVVVEAVRRHMGIDAAHVYGGLLAFVQDFCDVHGVLLESREVSEIKKHATGKGNADKAAMVAAARSRGWNPADDNEADALWLLDLVVATDGPSAVTEARRPTGEGA